MLSFPCSARFTLRALAILAVASLCTALPAQGQFSPLEANLTGAVGGDATWADVDNDGDLDLLVVGNESGNTENAQPSATLYENEGDGSFSPMSAGLTGVSLGSAAFGDFDGDGDPDLAITGNQGGFSPENLPVNSAQIYENDGSGSFTPLNADIDGVTVGSVDWGDVDGDGDLDLVVTGNVGGFGELNPLCPPICNSPEPSIRIYENEGDGSFSLLDAGIEEGVAIGASQFADIDDDGDLDLAVAGGQNSLNDPVPYAAIYENDGTGTFTPVDAGITDVAGRSATWTDVDGNGGLDLVLTGVGADGEHRTRLYLNDGDGDFSTAQAGLVDVAPGAVAAADMDLDGDPDLVVSGQDTTDSPAAIVYENDGTGTFTPFEAGLTPVEGSAVAWGDIQGDVAPDLMLAGRNADSMATATLYENQIGSSAQVQFVHNAADPAADTVDVYLGNEKAIDNFGFRSATSFRSVPSGSGIEAGIAPAGSDGPNDIVTTQSVTFAANEAHTVVASGVLDPSGFVENPDGEPIAVEFLVEGEADSTAAPGEVSLRAVHGATDAPTVDLDENGTVLFQDLIYGDVTADYLSVSAEQKRLLITPSDADTAVAAFQSDLSGLDGSAATILASGFLDPAANQNGPPLRLIAAQPDGDIMTFAPNQAPVVTTPLPDDTLQFPGPPLQVMGLGVTVFNDPDGDSLTISAASANPSVVEIVGDSAHAVLLQPNGLGTTEITITASDGVRHVSTSSQVTVEEQTGEEPAAQALAVVDPSGEDQVFDFGATGNKIVPSGIVGTGRIEVQRFGSAPESTPGISQENVSKYRTVITASGGLTLGDDTEVRFPVGDFSGIEDPAQVTVYSRPTPGEDLFEALPTSVDINGTPSDTTDDEIVATTGSFSEFVLASNTEPLPVELAGLEAVRSGAGATLRWQTAAETGNAGFRVQHRGPEAGGWRRLGFVDSKAPGGTTTEAQSYRFAVEQELGPGTHRFRLQQVDLDGSTRLSDPVRLEVRMQEAISVQAPAPNPASGQAVMSFAVKEGTEARVVLYNTLGQRVRTLYRGTPPAGQSERLVVDTGGLPSGVYVLQVQAGGQTRTQRLTVVR